MNISSESYEIIEKDIHEINSQTFLLNSGVTFDEAIDEDKK